MIKQVMTWAAAATLGLIVLTSTGCQNDAQTTALLGAAAGAGIGALAGGDAEAALTGAAIGGGAGYIIGNESDKQRTRQQIESVRAEQNTVTVWIKNSNGSQTPVKLAQNGPGYVGPRGEIYQTMPSEDQLWRVYGF